MYGQNDWHTAAQAPYGSLPQPSKPKQTHARKLHLKTVFYCWLIPCVEFTVVCGLLSSGLPLTQPLLTSLVLISVVLATLLIIYLAVFNVRRWSKGTLPDFPFWYVFAATCSTAALISAAMLARVNFRDNVYAYQNLNELAVAKSVDPAVDDSTRYMDAGRVEFVEGTTLALEKYIGFKNNDVYCVTPIVHDAISTSKSLRSASDVIYDYWAVGLNCCSSGAYKCGEYGNANARSGVRLLREDQRAFYALAVQEAQATYGLTVHHPLFFTWVEDSKKFQDSWQVEAITNWLLASAAFATFMGIVTVVAVATFAKIWIHTGN
eukprot:TRINITY_DN50865_c0_g1_i1.p1 TRINITY_DN50865_c0_g1~~TRINITY_DN50865_c0_g1_i1.p1  ORF type:complete len:360 (+),score=52.01 TRINITY_DN50865_c0_g1_i1:119-1081(+)